MTVKRSEPLKRVQIPSVDDLVDMFMENVPCETVDLGDPTRRKQLREWLFRMIALSENRISAAHAEASANAILEVGLLMRHPDFYEQRKRARLKKGSRSEEKERKRQAEEKMREFDNVKGLRVN